MTDWRGWILKHRALLSILGVYFILHLSFLTRLPIFNDEAIYLDWAWAHVRIPNHLFESLLDAKTPLLIWIFSIVERLFSDPLIAGRITSIGVGSLTLVGLYLTGRRLVSERVAVLTTILFAVTPIFVFYNRLALMEATVACVGIWSGYLLVRGWSDPKVSNAAALGCILGVGFLIKTSALLFLVSAIALLVSRLLIQRKWDHVKNLGVVLGVFLLVSLPILVNKLFWSSIRSNSRYIHIPGGTDGFSVYPWLDSIVGFVEISFVFMLPWIFLLGLAGTYLLWKRKVPQSRLYVVFFTLALILELLVVKNQSQRYLVSFLPWMLLPAGYMVDGLWRRNILYKALVSLLLAFSLCISLFMVLKPREYLLALSKISNHAELEYIQGQPSGYGVNEAMEFIIEQAMNAPLSLVFIAPNVGNPESAVSIYSRSTDNLMTFYIDAEYFEGLEYVSCFSSEYPTFFVARDDQLRGLERFFEEVQLFPNPSGGYAVRVYRPIGGCREGGFSLSKEFKSLIEQETHLRLQ